MSSRWTRSRGPRTASATRRRSWRCGRVRRRLVTTPAPSPPPSGRWRRRGRIPSTAMRGPWDWTTTSSRLAAAPSWLGSSRRISVASSARTSRAPTSSATAASRRSPPKLRRREAGPRTGTRPAVCLPAWRANRWDRWSGPGPTAPPLSSRCCFSRCRCWCLRPCKRFCDGPFSSTCGPSASTGFTPRSTPCTTSATTPRYPSSSGRPGLIRIMNTFTTCAWLRFSWRCCSPVSSRSCSSRS
mmetsp:Transcript_3690/g.16974  ORF Transcript_3690/g.16974 Transcript_3690/m.16974 type:complete len:242 (-) Transcript_3690:1147-1872(-)